LVLLSKKVSDVADLRPEASLARSHLVAGQFGKRENVINARG